MNSTQDGLAIGQSCCIYGVAELKGLGRFSACGLREEPVGIVQYEDLAALVSAVPPDGYPANRSNTIAHLSVQQAAMQTCTVLPMRFGVVAPSQEAVRDLLLRDQSTTLRKLLLRVAGKAELVLKVSWQEQFLFRDIVSENREIKDLRESILGHKEQESRPDRILLGQMVELELRRKREKDALQIMAALRPFACEVENGKTETEMMVLNAAFLVSEACRGGFDKAVADLHQESGKRLLFKYLGPLPPYSFVTIALEVNR